MAGWKFLDDINDKDCIVNKSMDEIREIASRISVVDEETVIKTNRYQTPITRDFLESMPSDVRDEFMDCVTNIEFIHNMISPDRKRARDLERDGKGRIIVDITHPHILEDMDYFLESINHFKQYGCYTKMKPNGNPQSEYYRWLKREQYRIWNGMVRPEDGEWISGYMYFLMNYSPIMVNVQDEENSNVAMRIEGWSDMWDGIYLRHHYLNQARYGGMYNDFKGGQHAVELSRRGAHPYDEKVPTPDGWKKWGDVKIGDRLYGTYGNITTVKDIPFDGEAMCFEIVFSDGRKVVASDDHLWKVRRDNGKFFKVYTTLYLFNQFFSDRYYVMGHHSRYEDGLVIDDRLCCEVKITGIKKTGTLKCKCVTVDSDDSCYLIGDYISTHNCGKSISMGSMMARNILFGENDKANKRLFTLLSAYEKEYLTANDGTLTKFVPILDHCAKHTQFPRQRLRDSMTDMIWQIGYKDLDTGIINGSQNVVAAISSKDNSDKLRGKRGTIMFEEIGTFRHFREIWDTVRQSVEEGGVAFAQLYGIGTSGNKESDFSGVKEIVCSPRGYNVYPIPNKWDKNGHGSREFGFFFPSYLNRKGCYDKDGNSDVVKALREILMARYDKKKNSNDPESIVHCIAELPIVPSDALLRAKFNMFPVSEINERIQQLMAHPEELDEIHVGRLVLNDDGKVEFMPTQEEPIREFPLNSNRYSGAIEIFEMPVEGSDGKVPSTRYIVSNDPVDKDEASSTLSLSSTFVLDLWTDRIVAEYTGRQDSSDDNYEILRRIALFYNARILYENNIAGTYSYFAKMNSLYLLEDTPAYLKEKNLITKMKSGNMSKGVSTYGNTKQHADMLIRNWLTSPVTSIEKIDGTDTEVTRHALYRIRNLALLKELAAYSPLVNVDRIRSLGVLMIYREQRLIDYGGSFENEKNRKPDDTGIMKDPLLQKYNDYMSRSSRFRNYVSRMEMQ